MNVLLDIFIFISLVLCVFTDDMIAIKSTMYLILMIMLVALLSNVILTKSKYYNRKIK